MTFVAAVHSSMCLLSRIAAMCTTGCSRRQRLPVNDLDRPDLRPGRPSYLHPPPLRRGEGCPRPSACGGKQKTKVHASIIWHACQMIDAFHEFVGNAHQRQTWSALRWPSSTCKQAEQSLTALSTQPSFLSALPQLVVTTYCACTVQPN